MAQYPNTMRGQLLALKQFTSEYVAAIKEGRFLAMIGQQQNVASFDKNPPHKPDLIASYCSNNLEFLIANNLPKIHS
jgi:hypothetical protein